jgi:hypothetical protein
MTRLVSFMAFMALLAIGLQVPLYASIQQSATGLVTADNQITFDEIVFSNGTPLTTEYSSLGVEFVPNVYYNSQGPAFFPGIIGNNVGNFNPVVNPFAIVFSFPDPVSEAAFGFASNPALTTVTALLNGVVVESLTATTTFDNALTGYFTLTGIVFDEIEISVSTDLALVDNIQFSTEPESGVVPEPMSIVVWASLAAFSATVITRCRGAAA